MTIEILRRFVPLPEKPNWAGTEEDWLAVEKRFGTQLPDDYRQIVDTYGSGSFSDFMYVHNPFTTSRYRQLFTSSEAILSSYLVSRSSMPRQSRYPVYPEEGGIFPWGSTDNGDQLFWVTNPKNNNWSLALLPSRSYEFEEFDCSILDLLIGIYSDNIVSGVLSPKNMTPPKFRAF